MQIEKNYDFCKRFLEVHKKNRRNPSVRPNSDEFELRGPVQICIDNNACEIIVTAAKDFADYLFTSFGIPAFIDYDDTAKGVCMIKLKLNEELDEASESRGHRITVTDRILVEGYDPCGIAQGLYYCEDVMNLRQAPYIKKGVETRRLLFHPRTIMSGYGVGEFPDEYLAKLAHHGFSGIMLWIKGPNETQKGYMNFKDLAIRAARYGFDIYVESYAKHDVYPQGEEAQAFYDRLYGELFAEFPFIKGLLISGEAVNFPSRDPSIPEGIKPGWWPCSDWPLLLQMIRNSVNRIKPDVKIILSSYNWGWCDASVRQQLISQLPKDVLLHCGWEMFEHYDLDGVEEVCCDYSLRIVKPGMYFLTEAESASKHGIKLETIANTGGKTWDFGAIPFCPAPYRWAERFEELRKAHKRNNLAALSDSIHYGVYPSFITEIAKWAFAEPMVNLAELIPKILAMHFGNEEIDKIDLAMKCWSEALANMVPTNEDQYGALRIGPAHPFYSSLGAEDGVSPPQDKFAMYKLKGGMYNNNYFYCSGGDDGDKRIHKEIAAYAHVRDCLISGLDLLQRVSKKNDELLQLINMGRFMLHTIHTVINRKQYFLLSKAKQAEKDPDKKAAIINKMVALLSKERQNAMDTIPLVEYDSILGFEPSMEYVADRKRLEWKINQVDEEIRKIIEEK